jgi:hypothetical protein
LSPPTPAAPNVLKVKLAQYEIEKAVEHEKNEEKKEQKVKEQKEEQKDEEKETTTGDSSLKPLEKKITPTTSSPQVFGAFYHIVSTVLIDPDSLHPLRGIQSAAASDEKCLTEIVTNTIGALLSPRGNLDGNISIINNVS